MSLLPSERAQYAAIIDGILEKGDLTTISAKQIRKGLQEALEKDISDQKQAVQELIMERFDKASSATAPAEQPSSAAAPMNGHVKKEPAVKRESTSGEVKSEDSDGEDTSPPKKKRKQQAPVNDAELAAMLQAQENSRARPTRGGEKRKAKPVKKAKKKSEKKVKAADDSDVELNSDGEPKEVVKKGGFHKQYNLSAPLADLVGEPTLSRPQVVKKIWAYIKERDLQDPADKRNIICDEKMQLVFKQDKVHMFTMNKFLASYKRPHQATPSLTYSVHNSILAIAYPLQLSKSEGFTATAVTHTNTALGATTFTKPSSAQVHTSMASTQEGSNAPNGTGDAPRGGRGRGRGRGRARGNSTSEGGAGGAGRRGRGGGNRGGGFGGHATVAAAPASENASRGPPAMAPKRAAEVDEEDDDAEVCFICASPITHHSVAPCNHRTCHICALRMRALYKTKDCAHCRTPAPYVIFTDSATKRYEEYSLTDITTTDENIGIRYENNEIVEDTLLLLRYNCPDGECDVASLGWPSLHRHVRAVHNKKMCDLCTRHKKVFTHEHVLFTDKELQRHMSKGDDNPGAVDQSGFKGHPLCGFCGQRFYGDDELYVHCREKHERCFICDRQGGAPDYYINFESLQSHFRSAHFPCMERECVEDRFTVFASEMDLKAHQLQTHGSTLSKDVRRDARTVDISSFEYRAPYVQERRGGGSQREQRDGRGRGRGRDPNAEAIPPSTAQPLRRDEQAFQRQLAIQSAQSVTTRNFGGQLTAAPTPTPTARDPPSQSVPRPAPNSEALATAVGNLEISEASPQDQARQLRHRGVIERATTLLQNDQTKLTQFRNSISSYKNNSITAPALIDSFFALFSDTSSTALGTLIREIADLFEDKNKSNSLQTAWNDWRAINEDYPSLPGPSGLTSSTIPLGWARATTSAPSNSSSSSGPAKSTRVLKLKSSTAQSSRSKVSQNRSWGSAGAASSSSNPFPGLPTPAQASAASNSRITTTPWAPPTSASSTPRATPPPSRPASRAPRGDAFPALPPAAKPQSSLVGYGNGRMVRRDGGASTPGVNAWGGSSSAGASAAASENEDGVQPGKKKGNKGKKNVIMGWG
ncbi:E3 ubiquitin-protein ligase hel2 [Phlyctema vagabunda]|uniref:RING-type E3 ubiquitin transferase n=1 Tax=Phlyctema vagabunda TaxID=108571 RepID=A0ABR4P3Z3_9HELO